MATNPVGDLFVGQGAFPPYTEATRQGGGWAVSGTGQVPIAAPPTTTTGIEIYNNSANAGTAVQLIIDAIFAYRLLGTASVQMYALWAQVTAPKAAPTNAGLVVGSLSGRAPYTTAAGGRIITAIGTTVIASGWSIWGNAPGSVAIESAVPQQGWAAEVNGRLIVPPGCSLCVQVSGTTAAGTVNTGARWYEALTTSAPVVL